MSTLPRPEDRRAVTAVLAGGLIAGAIDLTYACTYHGLAHAIPPVRILQSIASGWFGRASFDMGAESAAIGFVTHFAILIVAAAIFEIARRQIAFLRERAYLAGMAFGVAIYLVMNLVVLPLSAAPHFNASMPTRISDFAVHVLLLGPAIALCARHFDRAARR